MADEISLLVDVELSNGTLTDSFNPAQLLIDQTNKELWSSVVSVGFAAEEDLVPTDITNEGLVMMHNLDSANYVQWGAKDTTMKTIGRLRAGEFAVFRMEAGVTLRWQADTAAVQVAITVYGD